MEVMLHSPSLRIFINNVLTVGLGGSDTTVIDGFVLLQNIQMLLCQLRTLRKGAIASVILSSSRKDLQLEAEVSLLVEGLLMDHQVFQSFGFENLYKSGYLTFDIWKSFQGARTVRTLDLLEQDFLVLEEFVQEWDLGMGVEMDLRMDYYEWKTRRHQYDPGIKRQLFCPSLQGIRDEFQRTMERDISKQEYLGPSNPCNFYNHTYRYRSQQDPAPSYQRRTRLLSLNRQFRKLHERISRCARTSIRFGVTNLRADSTHSVWGQGFHDNRSKAWRSGMAAIRQLSKGIVPSNIKQAIDFLAVAKAMSLVENNPSQNQMLDTDVARWQVLFDFEDGSLQAFRSAIFDIWEIDLSQSEVQTPDESSLNYFIQLAMTLVDCAGRWFDSEGCPTPNGQGLLSSQERWREGELLELGKEEEHDLFLKRHPNNSIERDKPPFRDKPEPAHFLAPANAKSQSQGRKPPRDSIQFGPEILSLDVKAVLLIAGFIFITVLLFLSGQ